MVALADGTQCRLLATLLCLFNRPDATWAYFCTRNAAGNHSRLANPNCTSHSHNDKHMANKGARAGGWHSTSRHISGRSYPAAHLARAQHRRPSWWPTSTAPTPGRQAPRRHLPPPTAQIPGTCNAPGGPATKHIAHPLSTPHTSSSRRAWRGVAIPTKHGGGGSRLPPTTPACAQSGRARAAASWQCAPGRR